MKKWPKLFVVHSYICGSEEPSGVDKQLLLVHNVKELKKLALVKFNDVFTGVEDDEEDRVRFLLDPRFHPWGDQSDYCDHLVYCGDYFLMFTEVLLSAEERRRNECTPPPCWAVFITKAWGQEIEERQWSVPLPKDEAKQCIALLRRMEKECPMGKRYRIGIVT